MSEEEVIETPFSIKIPNLITDKWPPPASARHRQSEIENLTPIILKSADPIVLFINAPWGAGKTTFLELWRSYLESEGMDSIAVNAWRCDFTDDPLVPLLSELDRYIQSKSLSPEQHKAWKKAKQVAPILIKRTAVLLLKAMTRLLIGGDKHLERHIDLIEEGFGGSAEELISSFERQQSSIMEFQDSIATALEVLPGSQRNLIVFVDELDRCRPSFAIEFLERVKHVFNSERLVFVLAMNRGELAESIKGAYGPGFDGSRYLDRFCDLEYSLRLPDLESYMQAVIRPPLIPDRFYSRDLGALITTLNEACQNLRFQFRDVNQLVTRLGLLLRSQGPDYAYSPILYATLLALRHEDYALFRLFEDDPGLANLVLERVFGITKEATQISDFTARAANLIISYSVPLDDDEILKAVRRPWLDKADEEGTPEDLRRQLQYIGSNTTYSEMRVPSRLDRSRIFSSVDTFENLSI